MSADTLLQVSFSCWDNEFVAEVAKQHHKTLVEKFPNEWEAVSIKLFLQEASERTGKLDANKRRRGLFQWGGQWKYVEAAEFVELLKPFWLELLISSEYHFTGGPLEHAHILVMSEYEATEKLIVHEIKLVEPVGHFREHKLVITRHECPFSWGLY